jgi:hypothetical protein
MVKVTHNCSLGRWCRWWIIKKVVSTHVWLEERYAAMGLSFLRNSLHCDRLRSTSRSDGRLWRVCWGTLKLQRIAYLRSHCNVFVSYYFIFSLHFVNWINFFQVSFFQFRQIQANQLIFLPLSSRLLHNEHFTLTLTKIHYQKSQVGSWIAKIMKLQNLKKLRPNKTKLPSIAVSKRWGRNWNFETDIVR